MPLDSKQVLTKQSVFFYFKQLHQLHLCVCMCNNISVTSDKSICIIFIGYWKQILKFYSFTSAQILKCH